MEKRIARPGEIDHANDTRTCAGPGRRKRGHDVVGGTASRMRKMRRLELK